MVPGTSNIVVFMREVLGLIMGGLYNGTTRDEADAGELEQDETGAGAGRCTTGIGGRGRIRETAAPGAVMDTGRRG
jgi:hypothetical protein